MDEFKLGYIFLFVFIFSVLSVIRIIFKFIGSLLQNPPQKLVLSSRELFFFGLTISYTITYLISL
jgi:hypothetical protein